MAWFANLCCSTPPAVDPVDEKAASDSYSPESKTKVAHVSTLASKQSRLGLVKGGLTLLHQTLDGVPVPGLRGLIGAIIFVMDAFDQVDQNHDAFADLEHNVRSLETLLSKYRDPSKEIPEEIRNLIAELTEEFEDLNVHIQDIVSRYTVKKILDGSSDAVLAIRFVKRVDWAVARMTTGISLVSANSVQRLEDNVRRMLLDKITRAKDASWRHLDRPACLPGTRTTLLEEITQWFNSSDSRQVFWLSGVAGTGKTAVAQTVAELAAKQGKLGASFFCSRDSSERSNHALIFPTLAFQLAENDHRLAAKISDAVKDNLDISSMRPEEQLKTLLLGPLQEEGSTRIPLLAVVDALDECRDPAAAEKILLALSRNGAFSLPFFKVFVTSRPVSSARTAFKDDSLNPLSHIFVLHDMDSQLVDQDIRLFVTVRLQEVAQNRDSMVPPTWPPPSLVDKLVRKASSLFIFASTACQYIAAPGGDPEERLEDIANLPTSDYERDFGIDALYKRVFDAAFERFPDARTIIRCRAIMGTIILLQNPIAAPDLADILELRLTAVNSILNELRSLLIVPEDINSPVRTFHASLHDFLTDRQRCPEILYIDPLLQHRQIVTNLLKCMNRDLKRNICQIDRFMLNSDVEDLNIRIARYINRNLYCACRHWAFHLISSSSSGEGVSELNECLRIFAKEKMLYWIEVLSIIDALPSAISSLEDAGAWCSNGAPRVQELVEFFRDGQRALLHLAHGIRDRASQIYFAMPFLPTKSLLRSVYHREYDGVINVASGMEDEWNACLRTIDNGGAVLHVAFSPDGEMIATSGLGPSVGAVRVWEARTGELVAQSEALDDSSCYFTFLPDGFLVIGSLDGTLRVWDIKTSEIIRTLRRHTDDIVSIAPSATGSQFASGSGDTVYIWDTSTWESEKLVGACGLVAISKCDVIGAILHPWDDDSAIGVWDLDALQLRRQITGHTAKILSLNFSADGQKLVSAGADASVRIWDVATGEQRAVFDHLPGWALSAAFSPNGMHVAGSDNAVRVWDVDKGELQNFLKGHQGQINALAFSPDSKLLVSGSSDGTAKVWDWQSALGAEKEQGHSEWIQTLAISPNGKLLVTGSWDSTIAMWDTTDGRLIRMWKGHERFILSLSFSPDGRMFASAGGEMVVKFWNSVTGELERTLYSHPDDDDTNSDHDSSSAGDVSNFPEDGERQYPNAWTGALAFSPDETQLALETEQNLIIWDLATGIDRSIWAADDDISDVYSLTFSANSDRLASGHDDYLYEVFLDRPAESDDRFRYFNMEGVVRQIAYGDGESCILSSVGVVQLPETTKTGPSPQCLESLHLSRGWLVDAEGHRHCWVPEAYRGRDVHASHGLTRVVLGGTNGRPLILDLIRPEA